MLIQFFTRLLPWQSVTDHKTLSIETFVKELIEFDPRSFEPHPTNDISHLAQLRLCKDIAVEDTRALIAHIEQRCGVVLLPNHRRWVESRSVTIETFFGFVKQAERVATRLAS